MISGPDHVSICPENVCHKNLDEPGASIHESASDHLDDTHTDLSNSRAAPPALPPSPRASPEASSGRRETRLVLAPRYYLELRGLAERYPLARLCAQYLAEEVHGLQSPNTLEAKTRDLAGFVGWFVEYNGHGQPEHWLPRDTQMYLRHLEALPRAPTTVNRVLATLQRFARWCHELPGHIFEAGGLPTRGVKPLMTSEPDCKKLTRKECHQLLKAADLLVNIETHTRARPRRTRAMFALLYYTGLRVSEMTGLRRSQYQDGYLLEVARKGKSRSRGVYVPAACRKLLDDYLEHERPRDAGQGATPLPAADDSLGLFLASGAPEPMARQHVNRALQHLAREASKHRDGTIALHPHRLRHTFGAEYREKTGSDTETATALGHAGLQHVGRYVRRSAEEREAIVERLFSE